MFHPNDTVGPYTVIRFLGRGGFGEVWLGEKRSKYATTQFALKFPDMTKVDVEAIRKEASTWVKASGHPNVLPIIEADEYDGHVVIVSELALDGSLRDWLERHGGRAHSIEAAVKMMDGILAGLEHLHSKPIFHRDLKPDNILLQGDTPRLADFGLARVLKTVQSTQSLGGTPLYMSPEAFKNIRTEHMDLWAAAVIFYQLLSGRVPFEGDDTVSLMYAILNEEVKPLPEKIPNPLRDFVATALNKNINERYQTANAMRQAIHKAIRQEPNRLNTPPAPTPETISIPQLQTNQQLIPLSAQPDPKPQTAPNPYAPVVPEAPLKPARRVNRAVAGLVAMALAAGAGVWGIVKLQSDNPGATSVTQTAGNPGAPTVTATPDNAAASQLKAPGTDVGTFVQILEGHFMMGSVNGEAGEKPVHPVKIGPFEIGKYELTQEQWQSVMGMNPSKTKGANLPVENVSWNDAQEFIKKLNAENDGYTYRLPTEAEWEYVCRAGSTGDYAGNLNEMAWYSSNSDNQTHPVGQKKANAWGLHDLHGNVWEWCNDYYDESYYRKSPSVDPSGPSTGTDRVGRGGSWYDKAFSLRSAHRGNAVPDYHDDLLGFRLVRTPR
jgi:formylglycine-generating enzyme required for sulfatase activity/tRNA A-37 threonylcarbamoyl transferase component Bud32